MKVNELFEQADNTTVQLWTEFFEDGKLSFWQVYVGIPGKNFNAAKVNAAIHAIDDVVVWDKKFSAPYKKYDGRRLNIVHSKLGAKENDGGDKVLFKKVSDAITKAGYKVTKR